MNTILIILKKFDSENDISEQHFVQKGTKWSYYVRQTDMTKSKEPFKSKEPVKYWKTLDLTKAKRIIIMPIDVNNKVDLKIYYDYLKYKYGPKIKKEYFSYLMHESKNYVVILDWMKEMYMSRFVGKWITEKIHKIDEKEIFEHFYLVNRKKLDSRNLIKIKV